MHDKMGLWMPELWFNAIYTHTHTHTHTRARASARIIFLWEVTSIHVLFQEYAKFHVEGKSTDCARNYMT